MVSRPTSLLLSDLKAAAKQLHIRVGGNKSELTMRLLEFFGLSRPCSAPAIVVLRVNGEKAQRASSDLRLILHASKLMPKAEIPEVSTFEALQLLAPRYRSDGELATALAEIHNKREGLDKELQDAQAAEHVLYQAAQQAKVRVARLQARLCDLPQQVQSTRLPWHFA